MRVDQASTRVTALAYDADAMRARTLFLPFLLLLDGVACKDDEPTGNEFGEPCGYDLETEVAPSNARKVVILAEIPKGATGKLQRFRLDA